MGVEHLKYMIEKMRRELNQLVRERSMTDPEVLKASRELDKALNNYEKLLRKRWSPQNRGLSLWYVYRDGITW